MERKRTRSGDIWEEEEEREEEEEEEEEEDGEDWERRITLRKVKRVRYIEDDGDDDDDDDDDDEEEEEEDEEDNEQPGPSTQNTHKQRMQKNRLSVTCGNKKGTLDVEKLHRGEACIEYDDGWFFPPTFEELGGKGSSKKWKASIFYENKPLQFWFEQGSLTTKGFKRRRTKKKQMKMLSFSRISESPTKELEIEAAEGTQEDDVSDEELALETEEGEEERVGPENGGEVVDSGVNKSEEEEDQMEKGEMEDEDMPAVADNDKDDSVSEERETSTSEKIRENALQKTAKVIIERLPEFQAKSACQSKSMENSDGWCKLLVKGAQREEEREHNGSATDDPSVTASTPIDASQMSHPPVVGGVEEESGEEFTQSNERKEDGQRTIKTETGNSPTPLSAPATSSLDVKPESGDVSSLSSSPVLFTVTNTTGGAPPLGVCTYESTDATTSGHDGAGLQLMKLDTGVPQTTQASGSAPSSDVVPGPSSSCNLDTMDLDLLRREKIKLQLKVLKLQEEYYALKIKELRK
ncbi:cilia- and flagella-associated protein 251-like isoform X1 [Enoplosus armatus]|uniref:cilia- and flagella-associated protein 251-like isoform X1 n=1 Tax=Enoplosus armatus TaxID=215367 RepID=UPI003992E842